MVSIILTAWKEERTVGKAVRSIITNIRNIEVACEILLVCPDAKTRKAAERVIEEEEFKKYKYIKDPQKGKPYALNLAFEKASGEILVSTDGDVWMGEGSLKPLLKPFSDPKVGGVTGRPVCENDRGTLWGYWGHMFMDAAHKKRLETLGNNQFFAMSGYLLAVRNIGWKIPRGVLDDVFFSYKIHEEGHGIGYAPEAKVYVRQPESLRDWMIQKVRSLAGYQKIGEIFHGAVRTRKFADDLLYGLFPLQYAGNLKELLWSILSYPVRVYLWVRVWWELKARGKTPVDLWERVQSTK